MPSSRAHRIALALTVLVTVLLGGLMYVGAQRYRDQHRKAARGSTLSLAAQRVIRHQLAQGGRTSPPQTSGASGQKPAAPASLASAPAAAEQSPAPASRPAPAVRTGFPVLKLAAARGDCWAEVRKVSEAGAVVYAGIIASGQARTFRGKTLWVRLGAPESVDASVDGVHAAIPKGTMNVLVTRRGIVAA